MSEENLHVFNYLTPVNTNLKFSILYKKSTAKDSDSEGYAEENIYKYSGNFPSKGIL